MVANKPVADAAYEVGKRRIFELLRQGFPLNGEQERLSREEIHARCQPEGGFG